MPSWAYDAYLVQYRDLRELHYAACAPGSSVVDIGCDTERLIDYQYRAVQPHRYRGIDGSGEALN